MPGDAPCAAARITALTDDSTDAPHTAEADVPDGMLKDTVAVSTTVVGGMDEAEGLTVDDTEDEPLLDVDRLLDTVAVSDNDDDRDTDTDGDEEAETLTDILDDIDRVTDVVRLTLGDTLADAETE